MRQFTSAMSQREENPMRHVADFRSANETTPKLLIDEIKDDSAWNRDSLSPEDWLIPLPKACMAEFDEVVRCLQKHPRPIQSLTPATFSLTACAEVMSKVRVNLQHRVGFAVLDRVPVDRYSLTENKAIYRLLAMMLGQVVSQKWDGTTLYDVKDSGQALGHGVRRSVTNLGQDFHTDGGWLQMPPEVIGLFCLQPAQEGGLSRCASLMTAHNEMRRRHINLLSRLYRPFFWDRQAEHGADEARFSWHPVYQYDGHTLTARYYEDYIFNGYNLAGESLDQKGVEALETMRSLIDAPENWVEFRLEKGQIEFVNNEQLVHARTAFIDTAPPHLHRHMVRLWNRSQGVLPIENQERPQMMSNPQHDNLEGSSLSWN